MGGEGEGGVGGDGEGGRDKEGGGDKEEGGDGEGDDGEGGGAVKSSVEVGALGKFRKDRGSTTAGEETSEEGRG